MNDSSYHSHEAAVGRRKTGVSKARPPGLPNYSRRDHLQLSKLTELLSSRGGQHRVCYQRWKNEWIILRSATISSFISMVSWALLSKAGCQDPQCHSALLLLPGALFLMDSRKLFVLAAQFSHRLLITWALLLHRFLGKVFYRFMVPSLQTVVWIFSWGNTIKFLWKKYAFPHNRIFLCFPHPSSFSKDRHFYLDK